MATVTRENIGLLNDRITVKVAKEDYLPSFEKALKNYSKTANIPGFRKGMVPSGMIKKMHGQSVFTDEVLRTVEAKLTNYMQEEKLEIFAQPLPLAENDARSINMNEPSEYAFAFEVGLKPEFTITDLAKEKVIRYKVIVTEEMINEEVERLTLRHGNMTEPEAVTGEDNVLNVTFTETDEEGNVVPNGIKKENSLLVKYFNEEFRKTLMGRKAGDSVSLQIDKAFDAKEKEWLLGDLGLDAHDATAGTKFFNIDITKVSLVERAALDEKFFEAAFPGKGVKTEEEFRNTVKSEMETYWSSQSSNHLQHELYHVLLEHTTIDFPETFLKRWIQQGGEEPKSPEEADKEFPGFANQLKWTLITDKLVRDNGIDVTPEDIKDFAKKQLFGYMGMPAGSEDQPWLGEYLNRMMQDKKFVEDAYNRIQTDKVFGWAETQVNATEKPVTVEEFSKELDKHRHHHH